MPALPVNQLHNAKRDLPTPALLVDLDRFEANLARMQARVTEAGKHLRPHAKAHKCVEIARRQVAAGAVGVCVATLAEADIMTGAGIGVLLTTPVAGRRKTDWIAARVKHGAEMAVVVDHPLQADLFQDSSQAAGIRLDVLVDLDVGDHRTGIPCDERAVTLAREIDARPNLRFAGLQAYSVSGSHTEGREARRAHSTRALAGAIELQSRLIEDGLDARRLTGGSTGTWDIDTAIPEVTELQAGSYPLMDVAYLRLGADFAPALTVMAAVVSANHPDRVTVDAGFKALATDRPFGPEPVDLAGARWEWAGDEHGVLHLEAASERPGLGERIEFIAPHCDPTVNLYDRVHAVRWDRVEAVWPIKRRTLDSGAGP